MNKWIVAAIALFLMLMLMIAAGIGAMLYFISPIPPQPAPIVLDKPAPVDTDGLDTIAVNVTTPAPTAPFPPPPSQDGSQFEDWEGYFYYSLESFENAVTNGTPRTRFWFKVKRKADGSFHAIGKEHEGADSALDGVVLVQSGRMNFKKNYLNAALSWQYEGLWSAEHQRIEGTYGPHEGGFVLYPRRLSPAEIGRYEAPPPPLNTLPFPAPAPEQNRGREPKKDAL